MMTEDEVRTVASELRMYATHFEPRDWEYTRDLGDLTSIRYDDDWGRLPARIKRAIGELFEHPRRSWLKIGRWQMFRYMLHREKHLPDGTLDGGKIITFWEEDGEYLQFVQPTVGTLIAEWLEAEPGNPHAQLVAAEMRRIQDAYTARLGDSKDGDPDDDGGELDEEV